MLKCNLTTATLLLCLNAGVAATANARPKLTIDAAVITQDYGADRGSLTSAQLDYKLDDGDTTVLLSPVFGARRGGTETAYSAGLDATVYQRWSPGISTRTSVFIAENAPVFAHLDIGQDITLNIAKNTTVTAGARWARYFGGHDVAFQSIGLRYYFEGGSVSYRVMRVNPDNRDAFYGHLFNLAVNDVQGAGKTQLWLSSGTTSYNRIQPEDNISGDDYAAVLQRFQPLSHNLNLVAAAGITSYARPAGRTTGSNFKLGISIPVD